MRKHLAILILTILILVACAPQAQATEQPVIPNNESYPNEGLTAAQQAAITALSKTLNVPPGQITLVSTEAVEWPDGCLGVHRIDVLCTQSVVPGFKIMLEANGRTYEVHTNENGSSVVI